MDILEYIREHKLHGAIAAEIDTTRQNVHLWREVPPQHVHAVEKVTGWPRHLIRPDLYPVDRERRPLRQPPNIKVNGHGKRRTH